MDLNENRAWSNSGMGHKFQKTSMTHKRIKIKIGQRSKWPISAKQLVARNVHTNQQNWTFWNNQMEESHMGKNTESNKKRTWTVLIVISWLPTIVLLPKSFQNQWITCFFLFPTKTIKKSSSPQHTFFYLYTYQPSKRTPKLLEENPLISSFLFFIFCYLCFLFKRKLSFLLPKKYLYFPFSKIPVILLPNNWQPVS